MSNLQYVSDSNGEILYVQMPIEAYKALVAVTDRLKSIDKDDSLAVDMPKSYSVKVIRQEHAAAYSPWSKEEERQLKIHFFEGASITDIAQALGRNEGAITSRLKKLGIGYAS